jgi:dTDP-4-dehydrorhamnose reductase
VKVLVIAQDGQIRRALEKQLAVRHRPFVSVGTEWLQSNRSLTIQRPLSAITGEIKVVVNAISLECLERETHEVAIDDAQWLAEICTQAAIPLIQLSNSQVFDGVDSGRHREDEPVAPSDQVGVLLSQLEERVCSSSKQHIILRVGPLFSSMGGNLLTSLMHDFKRNETRVLSTLGHSCPTHVNDLARVLSAIIDQLSCGAEPWGTYHYCSSDPTSSYQFAETVLAVAAQFAPAGDQPLLLASTTTDDSGWTRPLLNCEKILNTFGIKQLPWRAFVVPTVKNMFESEKEESANEP